MRIKCLFPVNIKCQSLTFVLTSSFLRWPPLFLSLAWNAALSGFRSNLFFLPPDRVTSCFSKRRTKSASFSSCSDKIYCTSIKSFHLSSYLISFTTYHAQTSNIALWPINISWNKKNKTKNQAILNDPLPWNMNDLIIEICRYRKPGTCDMTRWFSTSFFVFCAKTLSRPVVKLNKNVRHGDIM